MAISVEGAAWAWEMFSGAEGDKDREKEKDKAGKDKGGRWKAAAEKEKERRDSEDDEEMVEAMPFKVRDVLMEIPRETLAAVIRRRCQLLDAFTTTGRGAARRPPLFIDALLHGLQAAAPRMRNTIMAELRVRAARDLARRSPGHASSRSAMRRRAGLVPNPALIAIEHEGGLAVKRCSRTSGVGFCAELICIRWGRWTWTRKRRRRAVVVELDLGDELDPKEKEVRLEEAE
ncbi:hypothetical protein B0H11DRAFT_1934428 [Mycena galericulata]|nr:hypothetical protein B0H11DRAFT_1934428 [Mycena galericulata]